jgi:hypothetical protein
MDTRDYRVRMPPDIRVVTACETFECDNWRYGWDIPCDLDTPAGREAAELIRSGRTGRTYRELSGSPRARFIIFRFEARQRCFDEHRTRPGRVMVMRGGRIIREHASLADLAEDYSEHMGLINQRTERG